MSIVYDALIERPVDIHGPDGFDPGHTDLFARDAIVIDAPGGTIWAKLIAAAAWPAWYSNASDVVVHDPSGAMATVSPSTGPHLASRSPAGSPSASRIPRIGWYGTGDQSCAYHTWLPGRKGRTSGR